MQLDLNRLWAKTQITESVRLRLYRKISKMLSNGLPLLKIIEELQERSSDGGRKPNEPIVLLLEDCRRMIQNGGTLSEGLKPWTPKTEQMIILAGEQSGRLESTLITIVEVVQATKKIKNVIIGGLAYPLSILTLVIVYIYIFGIKVIPQFAQIADPKKWHGVAKSLYVMSILVQEWMLYLVLALVALIIAILASMPRWCGNIRRIADNFAPYSIYRLVVGSGFLMAFSALQFAGVTVEKSLSRLSETADPWLRERLDGALLGVKSGLNCGEALRNTGYGFPSKELIDDLCIYAEYKGFAEALKMLADEWIEEGVENIAAQMKILNGISIVTMAIVIGWLVIGFFGVQQEIAAIARAAH